MIQIWFLLYKYKAIVGEVSDLWKLHMFEYKATVGEVSDLWKLHMF